MIAPLLFFFLTGVGGTGGGGTPGSPGPIVSTSSFLSTRRNRKYLRVKRKRQRG